MVNVVIRVSPTHEQARHRSSFLSAAKHPEKSALPDGPTHLVVRQACLASRQARPVSLQAFPEPLPPWIAGRQVCSAGRRSFPGCAQGLLPSQSFQGFSAPLPVCASLRSYPEFQHEFLLALFLTLPAARQALPAACQVLLVSVPGHAPRRRNLPRV